MGEQSGQFSPEARDEGGVFAFEPFEQGSAGSLGDLTLHKPADAKEFEEIIQGDGRLRVSIGTRLSKSLRLGKSPPKPKRQIPMQARVNGTGSHPMHEFAGQLEQKQGQWMLVVGLVNGGRSVFYTFAPTLEAGIFTVLKFIYPETEALKGGRKNAEQLRKAAFRAAPIVGG